VQAIPAAYHDIALNFWIEGNDAETAVGDCAACQARKICSQC